MTDDRKGHLVNGTYRLNLRIERDRHSESYLAVDTNTGSYVVLRMLLPEYVFHRDVAEGFVREAKSRIGRRVGSHGAVLTTDIDEAGVPYYVEERFSPEPDPRADDSRREARISSGSPAGAEAPKVEPVANGERGPCEARAEDGSAAPAQSTHATAEEATRPSTTGRSEGANPQQTVPPAGASLRAEATSPRQTVPPTRAAATGGSEAANPRQTVPPAGASPRAEATSPRQTVPPTRAAARTEGASPKQSTAPPAAAKGRGTSGQRNSAASPTAARQRPAATDESAQALASAAATADADATAGPAPEGAATKTRKKELSAEAMAALMSLNRDGAEDRGRYRQLASFVAFLGVCCVAFPMLQDPGLVAVTALLGAKARTASLGFTLACGVVLVVLMAKSKQSELKILKATSSLFMLITACVAVKTLDMYSPLGALGKYAAQGLSVAGAGLFGLLFMLGLQHGLRQLGNNTAFGALVLLLSFASVGASQQLLVAMVIGGGGNGLLSARAVASRILKRQLPSLKDDPKPEDGLLKGVTNYTDVPGRVTQEESDDVRRDPPVTDTRQP